MEETTASKVLQEGTREFVNISQATQMTSGSHDNENMADGVHLNIIQTT